jgi:hypothetical protein
MHRLLSKLKSGTSETRREQEPRRRGTPAVHDPPAPRRRRSLTEAAHKLHH